MRLAEVHGHIDVIRAGGETGVEDRLVQPWVAGVNNDVGLCLCNQRDDVSFIASINSRRPEPPRIIQFIDCMLSGVKRNIRERKCGKEGTIFSNGRH